MVNSEAGQGARAVHLDFPIWDVSAWKRDSRFRVLTTPANTQLLPPLRQSPQREPPNTPGDTYDMSSLLDAVLHSDAAPTPSSDAGYAGQTPRMRSSSVRPRGPPSESAGGHSDHEGFADDEVVGARIPGRRPNAARTDVPRQADKVGETVAAQFQGFLEE